MSTVYIVGGVSGSGKTTVGRLLAQELKLPFYDADDFHPKANVEKMKSGHPLNDGDREPWLEVLSKKIGEWSKEQGAVLGCSALKEPYRKMLSQYAKPQWIFLYGDFKLIKERMESRKNHYFDASLLQSQFDAYEKSNYGWHYDVVDTPQEIVAHILNDIGE